MDREIIANIKQATESIQKSNHDLANSVDFQSIQRMIILLGYTKIPDHNQVSILSEKYQQFIKKFYEA